MRNLLYKIRNYTSRNKAAKVYFLVVLGYMLVMLLIILFLGDFSKGCSSGSLSSQIVNETVAETTTSQNQEVTDVTTP